MSEQTVAGLALVAAPVLFNVCFALLAARFDYPDILRRPTEEVLERFRAGGSELVLIWWAFTLSALFFSAVVVLLAVAVGDADGTVVLLGAVAGVLASIVQFLGLVRWPFLVPYLAREAAAAGPGSARGEAVSVVFESAHRYFGVAVGEHLGYLLTGIWTILAGFAILGSSVLAGWLGVPGLVIGPLLVIGSLEFVGRNEESGWELVGAVVPIAYIAWSIWLLAIGLALLF